MSAPDFYNQIAQQKHGKPAGWQWAKLNAHNMPEDFVEVSGAVPSGVVKRGDRKGSPKWTGPLEVIFVRMAEVREVQKQYEAETGNCHSCGGDGKYKSGKECWTCKGTGKPKEVKP